ncbi:phosphoglycerate mutase-like protein [Hypoxylon fragiforme]|uniref:phosphoglycerate mutase-like protein n=1 Tax=Hypoxylon fragiforme TaxID=63214 RepID=UPI0020C5F3F2|nr:phosphoglycerate mutase-like protein [Hypoxylon fragiforme]KAI2613519.1 phosphoglycerate mutase-like protein [Hypoxylon fragiforme]
MGKTIILIRHGEAEHNIADDWQLPDPGLTEKGIEESKALASKLELIFPPQSEENCRIVVSPLKRTLQTAHYGLRWLLDRGVPAEVRAEWQETTDNPCDIGAELSEIKEEWPDYDFSSLDPIYPQKTGMYKNSEEAFQTRASFARRWLSERNEDCIIVVTHSGFLKRVVKGPKFRNVEYRTYELVEESGELKLIEIDT